VKVKAAIRARTFRRWCRGQWRRAGVARPLPRRPLSRAQPAVSGGRLGQHSSEAARRVSKAATITTTEARGCRLGRTRRSWSVGDCGRARKGELCAGRGTAISSRAAEAPPALSCRPRPCGTRRQQRRRRRRRRRRPHHGCGGHGRREPGADEDGGVEWGVAASRASNDSLGLTRRFLSGAQLREGGRDRRRRLRK